MAVRRTISSLLRHARLAPNRRDRALVLVPNGSTAHAYLFGIAPDGHLLTVLDAERDVPWEDLRPLHPVLAPYLPPVVVASPSLGVATLSVPVSFERHNPHARVHPNEFQEVLKKLQVSLWAEHRPRIAAQLGVDPIDAVLVSFRVESVRVGGSEVLNPSDLTGSPVELDVVVRFVARETFERAREATPAPFFADPAWTLVAGHNAVAPAVLLAQGEPVVLASDAGGSGIHEIARESLVWSPNDVARELELRWGLSRKAATDLLAVHVAGLTAGSVRDAIDSAISAPRAALDREIRSTRLKGTLLTASDISIPAKSDSGGIELAPLDATAVLRATGLEFAGEASVLSLAAFAEFYYSERYSELNAWLRQRIAWLGTAGSA